MLICATAWVNPENMQGETSKTYRAKYGVSTTGNSMKVECRLEVARDGSRVEWEMIIIGIGILVRDDKNVLKLGSCDDCTTLD